MTAEEIVRHWRQAKKRDNAELQVLAELNSTDKDTIRGILQEAGESPPKEWSRRQKKNSPPGSVEPGKPAAGQKDEAPAGLPAVYSQMEALLASLPEGASLPVRRQAGEMLHTMFGEYLVERLGLKPEDVSKLDTIPGEG